MNKENHLDQAFWENKYKNGQTGWDIGYISTPLKNYFDQLENRQIRILIPGCGNSYEAEYLFNLGFHSVHVLDWSSAALENFKNRTKEFPEDQLIKGDFFEHQGEYDLIVEQTFFCALPPSRRKDYARKTSELLAKDGKLSGLLFNIPLNKDQPPFGGKKEEYVQIFQNHFIIHCMESSYNSIPERQGNELFIILKKK